MKHRYLKAVLVATATLSFSRSAGADEHWTKLPTTPYTLNNKQDAIAFADSVTGWYGNGTGRLYRTTDGGFHWKNIWTKPGTYIRALEFVDRNTGFLGNVGPGYFPNVSDSQPLYFTNDAGVHWKAVKSQSGLKLKGVCAIDVLKIDGKVAAIRAGGRVGGPAALIESFDEGRTWHTRDMNDITGMILDIHFIDENIGFIAGASEAQEDKARARILKTTNGGRTWRVVYESDRPGDNNWKLAFPSPRVGYATIISYQAPDGEARGYVAKTEDSGDHWRPLKVTNDPSWIPYGINFIDENRGWVGGSTGGYETFDGGATWSGVDMGRSTNKIRILSQAGGKIVFAIGHGLYRLDLPNAR